MLVTDLIFLCSQELWQSGLRRVSTMIGRLRVRMSPWSWSAGGVNLKVRRYLVPSYVL